jgi:hypothetical protein
MSRVSEFCLDLVGIDCVLCSDMIARAFVDAETDDQFKNASQSNLNEAEQPPNVDPALEARLLEALESRE